MADLSRRTLLTGAVAMAAPSPVLAGVGTARPDAALFTIGTEIERLAATAEPLFDAYGEADEALFEARQAFLRECPEPEKPDFYPPAAQDHAERSLAYFIKTGGEVRRREDAWRDEVHKPWSRALMDALAPHTTAATEAEAACDTADRAVMDACSRLADERATSLEGLILKARLVRHSRDDISESIIRDLLHLGGEVQS